MPRESLPGRRQSETIEFEHAGFPYKLTVGLHPSGRPGEIFLSAAKTGQALQISTSDAAVAASLALQYGCPVDVLRGAFLREEDGSAAGALGAVFDIIAGLDTDR